MEYWRARPGGATFARPRQPLGDLAHFATLADAIRENAMTDIAALTARIDKLEHELAVQQDIHQIRRLQYTYGYFIDKSQYNEVVDLFSDQGDVWFLGGIYKGKAGVRRLYIERFQTQFTQGHNGPRYGWLLEHPQLQMVIDVAPDRKTANVRGRSTMQAGLHETATGVPRASRSE
jgi:hypothetical protein